MDIQADIAAVQTRIAQISGVPAQAPVAPAAAQADFSAMVAQAMRPQTAAGSFALPVPGLPVNPSALPQPIPGAPGIPGAPSFIWPASGSISSPFGPRQNPMGAGYDFHPGIDIAADQGSPIRAAAPGRVVAAGPDGGYGNVVVIDHGNGITSRYAHCSETFATVGETVGAGDEIATVGSTGHSTGPHLHFEVRSGDKPVDPALFLR
ncbi:MAG: M23 family metallopeptidase [Candidatus Eremiobacteraeota bacterium]|nr:M23 family metallopeptidase [Candidatus Eremiobacteraeota bacterium]